MFPELTDEQRDQLLRLGPRWNDDISGHRAQVLELYTPLLKRAQKADRVVPDIRYGPHERQCLDIFAPDGAHGLPVVVFIHGGAFTRGKKSANGEIYDNVLHWFARRGFVGVNVEYRLAPDITYPDGARDIAAAISWLEARIEDYGGDPNHLFIIGHSAGGSHLATYLADPATDRTVSAGIRAVALISARLDVDTHPDNPNAVHVAAYFGDKPELFRQRSPMSHAGRIRVPTLVAIAEFENRFLDDYGRRFSELMATAGRTVELIEVAGHNHTSIAAHINAGDDTFATQLLRFFKASR